MPYPPLVYAVAAPFARDEEEAAVALRIVMGVMEGTAPLLVFAILWAARCGLAAATCGAVTQALMPEGLLVLAKGVAANISGLWAILWGVLAGVMGISGLAVTGLSALRSSGIRGPRWGGAACWRSGPA